MQCKMGYGACKRNEGQAVNANVTAHGAEVEVAWCMQGSRSHGQDKENRMGWADSFFSFPAWSEAGIQGKKLDW